MNKTRIENLERLFGGDADDGRAGYRLLDKIEADDDAWEILAEMRAALRNCDNHDDETVKKLIEEMKAKL
jgi:hypothetical protein